MNAPFRSFGPYSICGVRLDGDVVVRLAYIDEAGISNARDEPFTVVAGAIIHADHVLNGVENQLERLMQRHIPAEHHENFVFSAKHLFNGDNKVFKREEWPLEKRLAIADEIMAIPQKFKLPITVGWIERAAFPLTFKLQDSFPESELTVAAHVAAFMNCAMWVEHWMRRETSNENCLLVVENNDQARKMIADVQRYHQNKKVADVLSDKAKSHFPFRKIKEDPLFQPKRQSSALIVADFCAYVLKKELMKDKRYDRFLDPIRKQIVVFEDV
jgi:hypothetical protein